VILPNAWRATAIAFIPASPVSALTKDDVVFINDMTRKGGYLDSMEWEDFGIWEEGVNTPDEEGEDQNQYKEHLSIFGASLLLAR